MIMRVQLAQLLLRPPITSPALRERSARAAGRVRAL